MKRVRDFAKRLARRSKTAIILYKIFDNYRLKKSVATGKIETTHGSTHLNRSVSNSLAYIDKQFDDYVKYAGFSPNYLNGLRILELGPGDNFGLALKFLAAGADSVVCLDRFYAKRNAEHERKIYEGLRNRLGVEERTRFDQAVSLTDNVHFNPKRLQSLCGVILEGFANDVAHKDQRFDLIVSCAVLEEIYDLDPVLAAMDRLLAPGGCLVHIIDLGDYGIFRDQGMHPLTFLTIPEPIYKRMAADSGLPNRKRWGYYVKKMNELGYQSKSFITSLLPNGRLEPAVEYAPGRFKGASDLVASIRTRLANDFKDVDEEDLLIDGALLVARKPL